MPTLPLVFYKLPKKDPIIPVVVLPSTSPLIRGHYGASLDDRGPNHVLRYLLIPILATSPLREGTAVVITLYLNPF